jgi:hypothetical protein
MCRNTIFRSSGEARAMRSERRPKQCPARWTSTCVGLACALAATGATRGDDVVIGKRNLTRVRIVGLSRAGLDVRMEDGNLRSLPLYQIDLIQVDRGAAFADFNQAERMRAEGRAAQSIARYRRAMRLTEGFWSEVIPARLLRAADQAGELAMAANMFVRVVQGRMTGPATAVRMFPTNVPDKRNGEVAAALDALNGALAGDVDDAQRAVLSVFRYRILHRIGASENPREARRVAQLSIPEPVRAPPVFRAVSDALSLLVQQKAPPSDILTLIDHAIRDCTEDALPALLLLKGAVLKGQARSDDDWIRASWPFLRVVIHFPGDPRVAEAYYGAAAALEKAGRSDYAISLLHKCVESHAAPETVVQSARTMLTRLTRPTGDEKPD